MAQRNIEIVVGRLITDEQFRAEFLAGPEETLHGLRARGLELSQTEVAALVDTDREFWSRAAERLDSRVQKVSLKNHLVS